MQKPREQDFNLSKKSMTTSAIGISKVIENLDYLRISYLLNTATFNTHVAHDTKYFVAQEYDIPAIGFTQIFQLLNHQGILMGCRYK